MELAQQYQLPLVGYSYGSLDLPSLITNLSSLSPYTGVDAQLEGYVIREVSPKASGDAESPIAKIRVDDLPKIR